MARYIGKFEIDTGSLDIKDEFLQKDFLFSFGKLLNGVGAYTVTIKEIEEVPEESVIEKRKKAKVK